MRQYLLKNFDSRRVLSRLWSIVILAAVMLLISSCASLSSTGVGRVKHYVVENRQLPQAFDGFRLAFISDIHYPSLFGKSRLPKLVNALEGIEADMLLLGGDYVTDNDSIDALFAALGSVDVPYGIFAVLGNHERNNGAAIMSSMDKFGIRVLGDSICTLERDGESIFVAGVMDSFSEGPRLCPAGLVAQEEFVILLAHTPDYAERVSSPADLVLSGHTHGGQVSILGVYTPVKNSIYGSRFLKGRNVTTAGSVMITTNGVGTSRRKLRFCVPSEIVVVELRCLGEE